MMNESKATLGLALAMLLSSLGTSIANVALPTLAQDFGASFQGVQGVVQAYLVGVTVSIVGVGRIGDLYGRRRVLLAGLAVFVLAAAVCGLAPGLPVLVAARLVQGVGGAVLMALTLAFVGDIVPREQTGRAMGLLGTTSAVGTALGPSAGGWLTAELGWRAIFLVQVPLGLLAMVLALRYLPAGKARSRPGEAGLQAGLALVRDPELRGGLAMSALVAMVLMTTLVVGPFYLTGALGLDTGSVGLWMAVGPLVAAVSGVPSGRLVDRFGARVATRLGLGGVGLGAALLAALALRGGVLGYVGPMVVLTGSYALFQTANNTAVLRDLDASRRGLVSGMLTLSRNLGLVAGSAGMGAVFAAAVGREDVGNAVPVDVAAGMRVAFLVAVGVVVVAMGLGGRRGGAVVFEK